MLMTVQNQNVKNVYRGNGSTTVFPFTFAINESHPEYIHVYITNDGGKAAETTDFTCDMDAQTVTYPKPTSSAPKLSTTQRLTIYRLLPYEQNLNLVNQGPFFSENVEAQFDDLEMQIQQLSENLVRCFQIGVEAEDFDMTMELEPGKVICVNSVGNGFEAREALMEVNGVWDAEGRRIHSLADPAALQDAATKNYVDDELDTAIENLQLLADVVVDSGELQHITDQYNAIDANAAAAAESEENALSYKNAAESSATGAANSAVSATNTAAALTSYLETKETLTAPAVDATLTISGAAAGAKVVGEKITDLEALTEISGKNLFDSRQFLKASGWTHGTDSEYYGVGTDLKNALGVNSSGLLVFGGFKANTQYVIRLETYATGSYTGNMLQIIVAYTDETTTALYIGKVDSWTFRHIITTAEKTISKIYIGGSYSAAANTVHFRNFQITEGAIEYPYEPYTPTAIDVTARNNVSHLVGTTKNYEKVMDVKCVKAVVNSNGNISTDGNAAGTLLPKSVTRIKLADGAIIRMLCFRDGTYIGKIAVAGTLVTTSNIAFKDFYGEINMAELFERYNATNIGIQCWNPSYNVITNDATAIAWFKENVTVYALGDHDYDFIPDYYKSQVDAAISNAKTDMGNCGREGFSFIFTTDNHWNKNAGHSPAIIKHVQDKTEIQDVVLGGDLIDGSADKAHELELLHSVVEKFKSSKYRLRYCFGNHDSNTVGQTSSPELHMSNEEVYMATQKVQEYTSHYANYRSLPGFYDDKFDYFWDDETTHTRIIIIDSYIEGIQLRGYQQEWFTATLESTPAGYRIIVIMHIWYGGSEIALQGQTIFDLVDAFNSTSTGAKVVAMFGGHVHRDENHETPGGVPLILTTTDQCTGTAREVVNDQAVDVITVDYKNNVIHCRRIGKGTDREFEMHS